MRGLIFVLLLSTLLFGNSNVTLEFLRTKPQGLIRDFYIWKFLDQNITSEEAREAYQMVHRSNPRIFGRYFQKSDNKTLSRKTICERMSLAELLKQEPTCIGDALKLSDASQMPKTQLLQLAKKVKPVNPELSAQLAILGSKNPLQSLIDSNGSTFATVFEGVDANYRATVLNRQIPPAVFEQLVNTGGYFMGRSVQRIVLTPSLTHLQESLAQTSKIDKTDDRTLFYLGLNALLYQKREHALLYFARAAAAARDPYFIDRALFWQYLTTQDVQTLAKVAESRTPTIYSIYATQKLRVPPKFEVIYEVFPEGEEISDFPEWNVYDPFEWLALEERSRKNDSNLTSRPDSPLRYRATESHLAFILQRESRYQKHYFTMPYRTVFEPFPEGDRAFLYALARQESYLIPTLISTSYALGMMQIMPFNVESIAKRLGENDRQLTDMFVPEINVRYAAIYLEGLKKEFVHPLFIAYAYNGGPGFMRKVLEQRRLFKKNRKLDPWYSLEMIPYEESRYYGTKVLANYIIYQRAFGRDIQVEKLLKETLIY